MKKGLGLFLLMMLISSVAFGQKIDVVTEEWAPYNYAENGVVKGMSTEIVEATLRKANLSFDIQLFPWIRAYTMVQENRNTLIYTISRTKERENMFKWVGPLAPRTQYLFKLKKREDLKVESLADVKEYITGVVRGDAMEQFLQKEGFVLNKNFEEVPYPKQNVRKLFHGRIDFITGNELDLAVLVKKLGYNYSDVEKTLLLIDKGGYYMAFHKDTSDAVVNKTRKAFEAIKISGKLDQIKNKYLK